MTLQRRMKRFAEAITRTRIYPNWALATTRGIDLFRDFSDDLPKLSVNVVFDVGAHVGYSAMRFVHEFADAHIYCFEPAAKTFAELQSTFLGRPRVKCFNVALGEASALAKMVYENDRSDMSRLLQANEVAGALS